MTQHDEAIIAQVAEAVAPLFGDGVVLDARSQQERIARAVLDALGLREVTRVDYDIVATDEDGRKVFQHGGDDPWRLRQLLADHPNRYRPGSRVERRIGRWLITDGTGEWERWEPIP